MLLKNKKEIIKWLDNYNVEHYELIEDKKYGYVVNVNGYVDLSDNGLLSIDVKFNEVNNWFECSHNQLESLVGCPEIVNGVFDCSSNKLESLKGCPKNIKKSIYCNNNELITLEGCPNILEGNFDVSQNKLKSLKGISKLIGGNCDFSFNELNLSGIMNLLFLEIKSNSILLINNNNLNELQNIKIFNEVKKILKIYQEKEDLIKILEITDKSVEFTDKVLIEKINKI